MARIDPVEPAEASGAAKAAMEAGIARWGRMTNMKRTLLHSPRSYEALMEWYPLFDTVAGFLGERLAIVFAHAVSVESECPICTTYMRKILIEGGDDPDAPVLDEKGEDLVAFARAIVSAGNRVPDEVYARVAAHFKDEEIVSLTAFAGLMVATNIVNNVLEVELDDYLYDYRSDSAAGMRKA